MEVGWEWAGSDCACWWCRVLATAGRMLRSRRERGDQSTTMDVRWDGEWRLREVENGAS